MVSIALTNPQQQFIFSDKPYPALCAGLGSGKSRAATLRLVLLLLQDSGVDGAYFMPSFDLLNLRAIPGVMDDLDHIGLNYKYRKSEKIIDIDGYGCIIFRSYDNPVNIIAFEVAHSVIDELDTLPKHKAEIVWRKVAERTRQKCKGKNTISLVSTPDQGVNGFFYQRWVKEEPPGYHLIKASTTSNPYLPADYINQIKSSYDPILAQLYIDGEFVSLSRDKVYHFFSRANHHTDRVLQDDDSIIRVGLDFNVGACVAIVAIIESGKPVIVEEFSSYDTQDFIINLTRFGDRKIIIYPDASGGNRSANAPQSSINAIRNAGFEVMVNPSNPAVRDRINAVNALLAHNKIAINSNVCQNLIHALESQGYTERGEPEKYNDHPSIDDWVDALGYLLHFMYPINIIRPDPVVVTNPTVHGWR